ncbi:alanine--tRNA ligase [Buchnera aphidicola]|uniref:alanine--tRNA ligase n=1 Tax=Buchnera aphidicola TaxID=9 RepID=UPI003463D18D
MKYTTHIIKNMFLNFFKNHKHKIIKSSSLIPQEDSNLLFTNAGMNQFQNVFLGKIQYPFSQVVSIQKCLRTGGKHNDLNQVGYSPYHNTFFEMLGNFSFGSYFKKEAILYAWKLLTHQNWFNIPKEKLLVTVYYKDQESYNIWKDIIKLSKENIIQVKDKNNQKYESDNFWQMNETGPCGPCTEIFFKKKECKIYDLNNKKQCIEIWNIVFIQFNKINKNNLVPLKTASVDTGMGLERIASVLQNVHSNYKIDSMIKIKNYICKMHKLDAIKNNISINIITDHIRAAVCIIGDQILPSNDNRGYILRKIIRRALLHGNKLGIKKIFFYKLVSITIKSLKDFKEQLQQKKIYIENILKQEELQFIKTLKKGLALLRCYIKKLKNNQLDSKIIFSLYDTIGFPIDLTKNICYENNIQVNEKEIKNIILEHKKNQKNKNNNCKSIHTIHTNIKSKFTGYKNYKIITIVKKIFVNNEECQKISKNQYGIIITAKTPFFAESGGQIGDTGIIYNQKSFFKVNNTQNFINSIGHIGQLQSGMIQIHDIVTTKINLKKRILIKKNHTATHLLQASLQEELQYNIEQKGSFINEKYLRFDFSYPNIINIESIFNIENKINKKIQNNLIIQNKCCTFENAKNHGYKFLKNKYYPTNVRILTISNFSKEICKGTHVNRTGEIGIFKIISCKNISFGIKRIEAKTGTYAFKQIYEKYQIIENIQNTLHTDQNTIIPKIKKLQKNFLYLQKQNNILNQKIILVEKKKFMKKMINIKNIHFLFLQVEIQDSKLLKNIIDHIKKEITSGIIILFYKKNNKYIFIASITLNIKKIITAIQIINIIKKNINGYGGGKEELAECAGKYIHNIKNIIKNIQSQIISKIS